MAQAKKGDTVTINYIGSLEDGTVFDSTYEGDDCGDDCSTDDCGCGCEAGPIKLVLGSEDFFIPLEEALVGMAPGEKKTVVIPAEDAFGEYDGEKIFSVPREQMPADLNPSAGQELVLTNDEDEDLVVTVIEVNDEGIRLDANHPLAGEDLTFELELMEIL